MTHPRLNRSAFMGGSAATLALLGAPRLTSAAAPEAYNITITHYPAQDYALPVVVAQELGYMAQGGIDVKSIIGSSGGGTTVRNISQGGLHLGEAATSAVIKAILAGMELKIIAAGVQTPGTICWVVKKDSPIKGIHDLAGKRIGFTQPGSVSESLLHMCLSAAGVDTSHVTFQAAGGIGENLTLLDTNGLDCAFTVDPALTRNQSKLHVVFYAREYLPRYLQTVWVAGPAILQHDKERVAAFIGARARGVDAAIKDPRKAADIFGKVTNNDPAISYTTLEHERPADYFSRGQLDPKALQLVVDGMRIGKILGADKVPIGGMVDDTLLAAAERTTIPAQM
ncbi:hypothetical protein EPN52_10635 [bacterium]|nr:MAG: hypothetical protein EPN52_10635 [bacterium]